MEFFFVSALNGLSYGLLLFMLSAGLTLIFSMLGVLNFAHASFYMLGAYLGCSIARYAGFWPALLLAPLLVGALGALFERFVLRKVHAYGHLPELLVTFGLSYVVLEVVQLVWGRIALEFHPPALLQGPLFTLASHPLQGLQWYWGVAPQGLCGVVDAGVPWLCSPFPATRGFMMLVALVMLLLMGLLLTRTRMGLVIRAALTHPQMAQALGHNVPRVFMLVFGAGAGLAGLAGVIGGSTFLTEPAMAASVGSIIFVVVVVGGMGSLAGAFGASVLIGLLQTFAIAFDAPLLSLLEQLHWPVGEGLRASPVARWSLSQVAPTLPYLLLVLMLVFRPQGLLGTRQG